jgi:hypothetical protein
MMFHSRKWLQIVADSGGRAESVPGAGHWFMETHPELVNERLRDWFAPLQRSAGGTTDAPMERSAGGTTDAPMERNPRD